MAVTDNFNRANGGLGANWTTDTAFTALTIVSNACRGSTGAVHNVAVYTASGTISADQYAQCKVTTTGGYIGPVLRGNGTGTFYTCYYPASTANATIYKWISGTGSNLASGVNVTPTVGDVVYFEAVGSTLTMKVNGVTVVTVTDSAITGAGYTGIDIYDNTAAAVDDFAAGALGEVIVNLTGVAASPAIGVLGFNVSFPLVGVAATPAIGTGTVTIGSVVVTPPDQGLVAGGGHWFGLPEDEKVYLTGVAANPQVGNIVIRNLGEMQRMYERYSAPIPRAKTQNQPEMPAGMRGLFKKVEKPIPPAVFVYQVGLPKLKSAVGTGKVTAHYEEIDEETIMMIDLL